MGIKSRLAKFKKFDKRLTLWITFSGVLNTLAVLAPLVNHYQPEFHCDLSKVWNEGVLNTTPGALNLTSKRMQAYKKFMLPLEAKNDGSGLKVSSCNYYNRSLQDFLLYEQSNATNMSGFSKKQLSCNSGYTFDFIGAESSAAAEFEMVCGDDYKKSMAVFSYMLGMTIGGVVSGAISDRMGRKPVFLFAQFAQFIGFGLTGFSVNYIMYAALIFFYGASGMVNFYTSLLIGAETTERKNRNIICVCMHFGYAFGYVLFVPFAYLVRDWRWFCKIGGLLGLIYIPLIWIVDESPRWLMATGQTDRAEAVINKIARINGETCEATTEKLLKNDEDKKEGQVEKLSFSKTFMMLFAEPFILIRLLAMAMAWCMVNVSYYGISLTTNALIGNRFINCLLSALSEFVSYGSTFFFIEYYGRRNTYIACMLTAGVLIIFTPWINLYSGNLNTAVTLFAKFCVTNSFYVVYIMTSEIFPTAIRHTASSIDSGFSRIGGIVTSFLIYGNNFITAPFIGTFTALSAVIFLLLPKTHNEPLPETIEDARNMTRGIPDAFLTCQGLKRRKKGGSDDMECKVQQA